MGLLVVNYKICVFGDYDVDGMLVIVILMYFFEFFGGDVIYYIFNWMDDGYGFSEKVICELYERGVKFVIFVDCGIVSLGLVNVVCELGMWLVIMDYYCFVVEFLVVDVIVYFVLFGYDYLFVGFCGVGVVFKLVWLFV